MVRQSILGSHLSSKEYYDALYNRASGSEHREMINEPELIDGDEFEIDQVSPSKPEPEIFTKKGKIVLLAVVLLYGAYRIWQSHKSNTQPAQQTQPAPSPPPANTNTTNQASTPSGEDGSEE